MNKPQMIFASAGAVVGVLLLAVGYFTFNSTIEASESTEQLEALRQEYSRIFKTANPFPNQENKEVLEQNLENAQNWEESLLAIFREGEYTPENQNESLTPGYFKNKREAMISHLTETAPKGLDGKSVAVEGLTFGFDKYKDGAPASKQHVSRLLQQLVFIENLVQVLYDSGIDKLKAVRREEFEDAELNEDGEEDSAPRRSRRRSSRSRPSSSTTVNSGGPVEIVPFEPGVVPMDRQRFEFVFDVRQEAFMKVLNGISTMQPYALISELSFEKSADDFRPLVEEKPDDKKRRGRSDDSEEFGEEEVPTMSSKTRTGRLASGKLHEAPITVTMTVDVFTYKPDESEYEMDEEEYYDEFDDSSESVEEADDSDEF